MILDNRKNLIKNVNELKEKEEIFPQVISQKKKLNKGPYILGEVLGEGAFAKVRLATQIHIKEKCAIKIIDKRLLENTNDIERLRKEIKILKKIRHKNIIQLFDIMESKSNLYFVMEYCKGGELLDYIVKRKRLSEKEACIFFQQIINGVEYLHNQGIIHRDLKPENLLLSEKNIIKISDFGLSTFYSKDNYLHTACGTPSYSPPEMLEGLNYNGEAADIWSCGIILYAMLCGALPITESKENIIMEKIRKHEYKIPDYLSSDAKDILNNILKINPNERYNISDIKKHRWFNIIRPKLIKGISFDEIKIPIDEKILEIVKNYGFNPEECKELILKNKFCSLTSIYYLCLKKYMREGGKSISDLESDLFERYVNNPDNYIKKEKATDKENKLKETKGVNINNFEKIKSIDFKMKKIENRSESKQKKLDFGPFDKNKDMALIKNYKEKEVIKIEENTNEKNKKKSKKENSLRNKKNSNANNNIHYQIGKNANANSNAKEKKYIKKNNKIKGTSIEKQKEIKKEKKIRNNISLYNIQNKIFSYEKQLTNKKMNKNEISNNTINENYKNQNFSKNKKKQYSANEKNKYKFASPNKKVIFNKKYGKQNESNNDTILSDNYCDKTFSINTEKEYFKKNSETKQKKNDRYQEQNKEFNSIKNENEKSINLLNYLAKKLVTSSFYGNLYLEFKKKNTQKNSEIYEKLMNSNSDINLLTKNDNFESKENLELKNKENKENTNCDCCEEKNDFKNLICILNKGFKNYFSHDNSNNNINSNRKNKSLNNNKYILNELEYDNKMLDNSMNIKENITPNKNIIHPNKINYLISNKNNFIDNNYLDISINNEHRFESKRESSLDNIINNNESKNYSFSLDKRKNKKNIDYINLDNIRNGGGMNTSHNKYNKNINIISEDDEFKEFSNDKDNNESIKYNKNKNKFSSNDRKISINLISNFNNMTNTDIK